MPNKTLATPFVFFLSLALSFGGPVKFSNSRLVVDGVEPALGSEVSLGKEVPVSSPVQEKVQAVLVQEAPVSIVSIGNPTPLPGPEPVVEVAPEARSSSPAPVLVSPIQGQGQQGRRPTLYPPAGFGLQETEVNPFSPPPPSRGSDHLGEPEPDPDFGLLRVERALPVTGPGGPSVSSGSAGSPDDGRYTDLETGALLSVAGREPQTAVGGHVVLGALW